MVTTVTGTKESVVKTKRDAGVGPHPPGGNGARKNGGNGGGGPRERGDESHLSPERYRIGVMIGIASILMMFTALASAYVVRAGLPTSIDWRPVDMPGVLYLSTGLIVASSISIALAHRAVSNGDARWFTRWLSITLALGLAFLASQFMAWRELVARGVYVSSNPHSSFFYVLTGLHGLHLLGGILALGYLRLRAAKFAAERSGASKARAMTSAVGIYWHFMDALWVFLFVLLFFWR